MFPLLTLSMYLFAKTLKRLEVAVHSCFAEKLLHKSCKNLLRLLSFQFYKIWQNNIFAGHVLAAASWFL